MQRALILLAMLLFVGFCLQAGAQSSQPASSQGHGIKDQSTVASPMAKQTHRPRLSLQEALKIAQGFIDQEHIDIAPYWLYRAMFILLGDEHTADQDKLPGWHFWWVSDTGELGNYVEIFVDMNGRASRMPSM